MPEKIKPDELNLNETPPWQATGYQTGSASIGYKIAFHDKFPYICSCNEANPSFCTQQAAGNYIQRD